MSVALGERDGVAGWSGPGDKWQFLWATRPGWTLPPSLLYLVPEALYTNDNDITWGGGFSFLIFSCFTESPAHVWYYFQCKFTCNKFLVICCLELAASTNYTPKIDEISDFAPEFPPQRICGKSEFKHINLLSSPQIMQTFA